jgi:hypothetical protein
MPGVRSAAILICAAGLFAGQVGAASIDPDVASIYQELSLPNPTPEHVTVCHGFGCKYRTPIGLSAADRKRLEQIMSRGTVSPRAERDAVANAVAWFQRRVAPEAGTAKAVARAGPRLSGQPSQFDCIDSSRNTTSTLLVLEQLQLLRHHRVRPPQARGILLDLRWPHATAVLEDQGSGREWAVDSWTRNNGEKPEVMLLDQWLSAGG